MSPLKLAAGLLGALLVTLPFLGPVSALSEVACASSSVPLEAHEFLIGSYETREEAYEAALDTDITWPAFNAAKTAALFSYYCQPCPDPTGCWRTKMHTAGKKLLYDIELNDDTGLWELWGLPEDGTLWWVQCDLCPQQTEG